MFWKKHEKSWSIIKISFMFLNKTEKNHEQIFFNLTKLIYTHASGHVNFWDFKLVNHSNVFDWANWNCNINDGIINPPDNHDAL